MPMRFIRQLFGTAPKSKGKRKKTALVIHEKQEKSAVLCVYLEKMGWHVEYASGLTEGMKILRGKQKVSLLVVDSRLTGYNSLAFLKDLRQDAKHASLPALLIMPKRQPGDSMRLREMLTRMAIITLPISGAELKEAIQKATMRSTRRTRRSKRKNLRLM